MPSLKKTLTDLTSVLAVLSKFYSYHVNKGSTFNSESGFQSGSSWKRLCSKVSRLLMSSCVNACSNNQDLISSAAVHTVYIDI